MKFLKVFWRKKFSASPWKNRSLPSNSLSGCFASPQASLFSTESRSSARQCSPSHAQLTSHKSAPFSHLSRPSADSHISSVKGNGILNDKSYQHCSEFEDLVEVFKFFDLNGDGKISKSELGSVLELFGDTPTVDDIVLMVKEADIDGDGFVDLSEFIKLHSVSSGASAESEELKAAFLVFDIDKNGLISAEELHSVFLRMGDQGLTMEDCSRMIKGVDSDGDGFVSFEEFERMMIQKI